MLVPGTRHTTSTPGGPLAGARLAKCPCCGYVLLVSSNPDALLCVALVCALWSEPALFDVACLQVVSLSGSMCETRSDSADAIVRYFLEDSTWQDITWAWYSGCNWQPHQGNQYYLLYLLFTSYRANCRRVRRVRFWRLWTPSTTRGYCTGPCRRRACGCARRRCGRGRPWG